MSDFMKVPKQEYVVNMIGLGYAVELLAMFSRLSREDWAESIAEEANKRFRELSDREIERVIEIAQNGRGNSIGFTLGDIKEEEGGCDEKSN